MTRSAFCRTPVVPQMEEQDCAAACLTSVLAGLGRRASLPEVNRRCGITRDGASAGAVVRAAGTYGVKAAGRRINRDPASRLRGLEHISAPSMVLMDGPHFAVFEGVKRGAARVNDPSLGRYSATPDEFWDDFKGVAVGFTPGPDFRRGGPRFDLAKDLLGRIRPYRVPMLVAVVLGVAMSGLGVVISLVLRQAMTVLGVGAGHDVWGLLSGAALVVAVSIGLGTWLQQAVLARVLAAMSARSSTTFLWRMLRLPGTFFHRRSLGGLVTRVQLNDGMAVLLSGRLATCLIAVSSAAVYLSALIWLAPSLAPVAVVVAVTSLGLLTLISRRRSGRLHTLHNFQARRDAVAFAGVSAIETLKAEGSEDAFFRSWASWQTKVHNISVEMTAATIGLFAGAGVLGTAASGLVVVLGMHLLNSGSITYPTLLVFLFLMNGFLMPISSLVGIGSELLVARAQAALLSDVQDADLDPTLEPVLDDTQTTPVRGELSLRDISFGYDRSCPALISDIDLTVAPGEWVAVIGASGSGKSTLARIVAGALSPWTGSVNLDGVPRPLSPRARLTGSIAYVQQTPQLFQGSVRDNLTLWSNAYDDDRLWAALRSAAIDDVVIRRGGLDGARIDEDARNLSGGERQRLELARALTGDPVVLVLDEATSALDTDVEARANQQLRDRGCACLIFAHRLSTVLAADRVVVLDAGRIVQQGRPEELAASGGAYRELLGELT